MRRPDCRQGPEHTGWYHSIKGAIQLQDSITTSTTTAAIPNVVNTVNTALSTHTSNTNSPHSVTSTQVLPDQTGQNGKLLTTNGTTVSWTPAVTPVNPSVTDNFVSFSNTTGGQKDSGKKAADFEVAGAAATVQGNLNTHTSATGTAVHGLGNAATKDVGVSEGQVAAGNHSHSGLAPTGGTTGQLLAKSSDTDYDFGWITHTNGEDKRNLVVKCASATTITIKADILQVGKYNLTQINETVDIEASPGIIALDTGSKSKSTWYAIFVIYNPTTHDVAGLLSKGRNQAFTSIINSTTFAMLNTSGFNVGDAVAIYSGAGRESSIVTDVQYGQYIIVDSVIYTHNTTTPLIVTQEKPGTTTWTPVLPEGYTEWRHVGYIFNDGSGGSGSFYPSTLCHYGRSSQPRGDTGSASQDISSGFENDGNAKTLSLMQLVPPGATGVHLRVSGRMNASGSYFSIYGHDDGDGSAYSNIYSGLTLTSITDITMCTNGTIPLGKTRKISYLATNNNNWLNQSISIAGYLTRTYAKSPKDYSWRIMK